MLWILLTLRKTQPNKSSRKNYIGPVVLFSLRLVADWCGYLALGTLFSSIDNEEQRRVHSYTPEVKRLPQRGNVQVRWLRKKSLKDIHTSAPRVTHWPRLYALYCVAWPAVREWQQCHRSGPPSCLRCCKPSQRCTSPRCPPSQMYCRTKQQTTNLHQSGFYCEARGELEVQKWKTHKAMRPSDAMLNTTLPRAATPTLRPCVREERVRASTMPTRPDGDLNWGEEHGPKADVLRFASIERSRRAFTFPWEDREVECENIFVVLLPPSGSNWVNMGQREKQWLWLSTFECTFSPLISQYYTSANCLRLWSIYIFSIAVYSN